MRKRMLIGLLSAGLVGAMLPGVAAADGPDGTPNANASGPGPGDNCVVPREYLVKFVIDLKGWVPVAGPDYVGYVWRGAPGAPNAPGSNIYWVCVLDN